LGLAAAAAVSAAAAFGAVDWLHAGLASRVSVNATTTDSARTTMHLSGEGRSQTPRWGPAFTPASLNPGERLQRGAQPPDPRYRQDPAGDAVKPGEMKTAGDALEPEQAEAQSQPPDQGPGEYADHQRAEREHAGAFRDSHFGKDGGERENGD